MGNCIASYFFDNTTTNDISVLNGLFSAFTSGELATELFAEKLKLKQVIIINEEETCLDKAIEDVFEAVLAAINIIFDTEYRRGIGMMVCYNVIDSILNEIDFDNFVHKIFPPKTELKELFNENQHKGFIFERQYNVAIGDGHFRDVHESAVEKIRVSINLPPELSGWNPPVYEEYGPRARVERNASLLFLEFFRNRGLIPKPKNRDLGIKMVRV